MTLNIQISPETEERLKAKATAMGTDVATFVLQTLEEKLSESNGSSISVEARLKGWENFVSAMSDWSRTLPPGHKLDDSRDSIYEGRGE